MPATNKSKHANEHKYNLAGHFPSSHPVVTLSSLETLTFSLATLIMKAPFTSIELFRREFNTGLHRLAELGSFGTFILACANATGDEALLNDIRPLLEKQYQDLYETCRTAFLKGRGVDVVDEDLLVFLKLHTMGFEEIRLGESRSEGVWKIQFNHLRSFRPKRISQFVHTGLMSEAFNEDGFNFNKPFMARPPKKSLSQNYLTDESISGNIVIAFDIKPDDNILEIGARHGALTKYIVKKTSKLTAIELDKLIIVRYLQKTFPD